MPTLQRSKLLHSIQTWKEKALARRAHIKALKKRLAELAQSRDGWKRKAQHRQQQILTLQVENARLAALKAAPEKTSALPGTSIPSKVFKHSSC
jgi:hypothetical protein